MAENGKNNAAALISSMSQFLNTKTVVGEPILIKDTTIIPLMDVTFGSAVNGSGGGMGAKISPKAILVIKDGHTRLVNINSRDNVSKILDLVPDMMDRFVPAAPKKAEKE